MMRRNKWFFKESKLAWLLLCPDIFCVLPNHRMRCRARTRVNYLEMDSPDSDLQPPKPTHPSSSHPFHPDFLSDEGIFRFVSFGSNRQRRWGLWTTDQTRANKMFLRWLALSLARTLLTWNRIVLDQNWSWAIGSVPLYPYTTIISRIFARQARSVDASGWLQTDPS